ncbi:eIF-2-alpha kinase GCN2-like isoform X1 [Lytechinus variegatus]|uniref:eIF-2-alpha kinase GCN2-like isoform X1 n=1 Tax=Lytechinus variegatus TaxID=7654 RepID=UPI001BB12524|nr:eIF-2-alpha kinase GCN2-like isoform X1 [Lytechinus variegatus]
MADKSDLIEFRERQENEVEVLKAIFMDDFQDKTRDPSQGLEVHLHLMPQQGMSGSGDVHVMADMTIICPPKYPDQLPTVTIENGRGISKEKLKQVKKEVDNMAKKLRGEVMILELAQHVQQFLHSHNVPGPKSFYEEMMSNQKRAEEKVERDKRKQQELRKKREERERLEIDIEIQRRQDAMKELKKRKDLTKQDSDDSKESRERHNSDPPGSQSPTRKRVDSGSLDGSDSSSPKSKGKWQFDVVDKGGDTRIRARTFSGTNASRQLIEASHQNSHRKARLVRQLSGGKKDHVTIIKFHTKGDRNVHKGRLLGSNQEGSSVYAGMDAHSGDLLTIREWVIKWKHGKGRKPLPDEEQAAEACLKQCASVEQELLSLLRLEHANIVHYLAINYNKGKEDINVQLLMEFVGGGNLSQKLENVCLTSFDLLREYAIDLLNALQYLHSHAVVHKQLRASQVYVDCDGRLRVANYSMCKRLNELAQSVNEGKQTVRFSDDRTYGGRGGKKGDVLDLGLLLLGLLLGTSDVQYPCEVPQDLPLDLQDFLKRCIDIDERSRANVQSLLDHPFIKPTLTDNPDPPSVSYSENRMQEEDPALDFPGVPTADINLGVSRLQSEFEFLTHLGKGGFGSVIKVRNKLDGNLYAIKKILLNPKSRELNKKITREVKLLSRLNHENVVRYYNSWIEVAEEPPSTDTEDSKTTGTVETSPEANGVDRGTRKVPLAVNSLSLSDNIEEQALKLSLRNSVEWSSSGNIGLIGDSDDSSSDDEGVFGRSFLPPSDDSSSDGIDFERSDGEEESETGQSISKHESKRNKSKSNEEDNSEDNPVFSPVQYLYIQMEFCEKSTLRTAIDAGMYDDKRRLWTHFREIIEGLAHIHLQGMIHRDLKPVNIFLDSNDFVKIGDFGLATSEQMAGALTSEVSCHNRLTESSQSGEATPGNHMTGKVGTALYVAPELCKARSSHYNQKVDLYSLGIIFFEMCYRSLSTGMERVKILGQIRQESIQLPEDFDELRNTNETAIIHWLLNHDPKQRPTSHELLESKLLPPPQMEDARLQDMLHQTVANRQSKGYHYLMTELFAVESRPVADFTYDIDMHKGFSLKNSLTQQMVYDTVQRIFQKHGAVRINTIMLLPKTKLYEHSDMCAHFMDHSGGIMTLPYDLRVPFARYIARNNVTNLKRYSIERVFRERKLFGSHPRELTECAFDIVTNSRGSLQPDAEVLHLVTEIINEIPELQARNYSIRLNHTGLLTAILNYCGVPEELHGSLYRTLNEARTERLTKVQTQTRLCGMSFTEQQVASLYQYIDLECPLSKLITTLKPLTKGQGQNASMVKQALHELEVIISQTQVYGVKLEMLINVGLVYNIQIFSGVIFQFVASIGRPKKRPTLDVLAAGGRYDKLVPEFKKPHSTQQNVPGPLAVGISVSFEKIISAVLQESQSDIVSSFVRRTFSDVVGIDHRHVVQPFDGKTMSVCDILVVSVGSSTLIRDRIKVVRNLWAAGFHADILYDDSLSLEEAQDYCRAMGISHLVILKDSETLIKVRSFDKEKVIVESSVNFYNLVEHLQMKFSKVELTEQSPQVTSKSKSIYDVNQGSGLPQYRVDFITMDKLDNNARKRYERQIQVRIESVLEMFSSRCIVVVIAVDLPLCVLKNMAVMLDFDSDGNSFQASVSSVTEKYNKYRKYINKIADEMFELKQEEDGNVPLVLYTYREDGFKVVL